VNLNPNNCIHATYDLNLIVQYCIACLMSLSIDCNCVFNIVLIHGPSFPHVMLFLVVKEKDLSMHPSICQEHNLQFSKGPLCMGLLVNSTKH
jgi:hypothetical protein